MSSSIEKTAFPDIILKRDNYEEWRQFILRKLNKTPMMLTWIQGNQDEEMDFTVIPFQTRGVRTQEVAEPGSGRMVDVEVEEWHTHQAYMGEGPRAAEILYKSVRYRKEQESRKWTQQKEEGWTIINDYISLDVERDLQRIPMYGAKAEQRNVRWLWTEVRKIGTGQGSSSIARCMKKLQSIVV